MCGRTRPMLKNSRLIEAEPVACHGAGPDNVPCTCTDAKVSPAAVIEADASSATPNENGFW